MKPLTKTVTVDDLFPRPGSRNLTHDDIAALRDEAMSDGEGDVVISSWVLLQLLCDWLNMDKELSTAKWPGTINLNMGPTPTFQDGYAAGLAAGRGM